jgi:hypothetical protein
VLRVTLADQFRVSHLRVLGQVPAPYLEKRKRTGDFKNRNSAVLPLDLATSPSCAVLLNCCALLALLARMTSVQGYCALTFMCAVVSG